MRRQNLLLLKSKNELWYIRMKSLHRLLSFVLCICILICAVLSVGANVQNGEFVCAMISGSTSGSNAVVGLGDGELQEPGTPNSPDPIIVGTSDTEEEKTTDAEQVSEDEETPEGEETPDEEQVSEGEETPDEEQVSEDEETPDEEQVSEGEETPDEEQVSEGEETPDGESGASDEEKVTEEEEIPEKSQIDEEEEDEPAEGEQMVEEELPPEEVQTDEETENEETEDEESEDEETERPAVQKLNMVQLDEVSAQGAAGTLSLNSYNGGGTIKLEQDVTASGVCQLSGTLDIDLNGHTLTMANGASFMLSSDSAVLNIRDTSSTKTGIIYASCQLVWGYNGGTFNLYSGILDGSTVTSKGQQGGCVNLARSNMGTNIFNMYGGTIRNFESTQYGGAVYVGSTFSGKTPVFTMYGGTIENCYSPAGSGVYVDNSGDGPGYFYMKGGASAEGESKATINCATYNGTAVPNAIYNYGYFGMEGVVDISGIVFLRQNNWADTVTHFIKITGRLIVVGDGYIDVDTDYPGSNAICTGHTVVENATQTEGTSGTVISQEEFYTYASYFINTTKGLMISAGFDPTKQEMSNGSPANWPSYQADKYSSTYTYVDVMGQTLLIQASDSPGDKREMQNYNYLIYTDRADKSQDYAEFYSIKISKRDINTDAALDGATFRLKREVVSEEGTITYEDLGNSGTTGDYADGVQSGETYIYLSADKDGKLMIADGTYILVEETAPAGYIARGELATIIVKHELDESTGELVSVVRVIANNKVLTTTEQIINSTYGDKGYLVNKEVVLYLNNSTEVIRENIDYKIQIEKYQDSLYQTPLANAGFVLNTTGETMATVSNGLTDANGILKLLDLNGSEFTFSNGDSYELQEARAPDEYYIMDDKIELSVNDDNQVMIDGRVIADGQTMTMTDVGATAEHGSWIATLSGELLTLKVYDEKMPPYWQLEARKYGTQVMEALALAGAEFTLYKVEMVDGIPVEAEVVSVTSSDGTDGKPIGTMLFTDDEGAALRLECNATYILREIYAPQGYELAKDIVFIVNEDGSSIEVTQNEETYSNVSFDAENKMVTLSITNEAVYHMPETGGSGIYPLVSVGISIMCITAVLLMWLSYKRKSTD